MNPAPEHTVPPASSCPRSEGQPCHRHRDWQHYRERDLPGAVGDDAGGGVVGVGVPGVDRWRAAVVLWGGDVRRAGGDEAAGRR